MAQIISVISYRGGTGKSLLAFAIAAELAKTDNVLLIEADFLAPSLYLLLEPRPQYTWNDYLLRRCGTPDVLYRLDDETRSLTVSCTKPDDQELLKYFQDQEMWSKYFSERIVDFLNEHREEYDFIFFDNQSGMFLSTLTHSFFSDVLIMIVFPDNSTVQGTINYLSIQNKPFYLIWNHVLEHVPEMRGKIEEWTRAFKTLTTYRGTLARIQFDETVAVKRWIEGKLFIDDENSEFIQQVSQIASFFRKKK